MSKSVNQNFVAASTGGGGELDLGSLELPTHPLLPLDLPELDWKSIREDKSRVPRASSYTIYVDLKDDPEHMLLVQGYTGAYDKVSRRVATYLRSLETTPAPKPLYGQWTPEPAIEGQVSVPSETTLARLKQRGHLTTLTVEEERSLFARLAAQRHLASVHGAPNYVLMPTYQCNLRCAYCFQDHMRTNPAFRHLLRTMQPAMVDRIFAGIERIDAAHHLPENLPFPRQLTLFGGEPLLRESRPVIEYILQKTSIWKSVFVTAVTNGTELDAYEGLLGPRGINALQITLDGPPREHDRRRIYADGSGSFERIAKNLERALEAGTKIRVRMNVDRSNLALLPELVAEFDKRGWNGHPGFFAYVAPIHASNDQTDAKSTFNSWQLNQALDELKQSQPGIALVGSYDDRLLGIARGIFARGDDPTPNFKASFCGAHGSMYVIDAFADIYACWERTGDPKVRIGSIAESGELRMNRPIVSTWRSRNVTSNPVCQKCRYALYCGGGCAVLAEGQSGNLHSNFCDGFSQRLRASVAKAYVAHLAGSAQAPIVEQTCDT